MNLYKCDNWEVVFVNWFQEFTSDCIITSNKETLSDFTTEEWIKLGNLKKLKEKTL